MRYRAIQNLIRQACHYEFNTRAYQYFYTNSDKDDFERVLNSFWPQDPEKTVVPDDLDLLIKILSERWNRFKDSPIFRDSYLVVRAKIDRFFIEIAKELAVTLQPDVTELPTKTYYDYLMPTLKNGFKFPTTEKFRKNLTISEDGQYLISLDELKEKKNAVYSQSEGSSLLRHEFQAATKADEIKPDNKLTAEDLAKQCASETKEISQDDIAKAITYLLTQMEDIGKQSELLRVNKIKQQNYFNHEIKKFNLEQLTTLSTFMNSVQLKEISIENSKFNIIRKRKLGYGNTSSWREMRHAVKALIVDALREKYKKSVDGRGKIILPEDVYTLYAEILSQNTHHKHNYFKYPDSYKDFKKYFILLAAPSLESASRGL